MSVVRATPRRRLSSAVLYATIWTALLLFVVAEIGKGPLRGPTDLAGWVRPVSLAGALLAVAHSLIAFAARYGWDHGLAARETARQAETIYGVAWSGSIYVNYLFIALWLTVAWRWRHWAWRAFVLVMVVNGAIVFARPFARPFGALLVAVLVWTWWPRHARSPIVQQA